MLIKQLDQISSMTEHPDAPYGEIMIALVFLYELYNPEEDNPEDRNAWAEHADKTIQDILRNAGIVK